MAYNWITLKETSDWTVDYDTNGHRYRVSYFENGHFVDEVIFREYTSAEAIIECPQCKVCSISIDSNNSANTTTCPVCGVEVDVSEYRKLS